VGPRLTDEEWAHRSEHSVEFVATFLQHSPALAKARIVPILCGGLFDELRTGSSPACNSGVACFCEALRAVTGEWEERGQRVGFIVSVDGAHMGTQFGDDAPLTPDVRQLVEAADREFWSCVSKGDIEAMHNHLARDNNARNVDAHPALYALWHAFPHLGAELQHYRQAYNRQQNSMVTFAALTLYQPERAH
jgi:AmmeMemoRadiSam system protein B